MFLTIFLLPVLPQILFIRALFRWQKNREQKNWLIDWLRTAKCSAAGWINWKLRNYATQELSPLRCRLSSKISEQIYAFPEVYLVFGTLTPIGYNFRADSPLVTCRSHFHVVHFLSDKAKAKCRQSYIIFDIAVDIPGLFSDTSFLHWISIPEVSKEAPSNSECSKEALSIPHSPHRL